eukprot:Pgem_evm1s13109
MCLLIKYFFLLIAACSSIIVYGKTCPSGTQLVADNCVPIQCRPGMKLEGNICVNINCPRGTVLIGDKCERNCVVGSWTSWSACSYSGVCNGNQNHLVGYRTRSRSVTVPGISCPSLHTRERCGQKPCQCSKRVSNGNCVVEQPLRSGYDNRCVGIMKQTVVYEGSDCQNVNNGESRQPCVGDCIVHKEVGECEKDISNNDEDDSCQGTQAIKQTCRGTQCPNHEETIREQRCALQNCGECPNFGFKDWTECKPNNYQHCNIGDEVQGSQERERIDGCYHINPPAGSAIYWRSCSTTCGENCDLATQWSEWGACVAVNWQDKQLKCSEDGSKIRGKQEREKVYKGTYCPSSVKNSRDCEIQLPICCKVEWSSWSVCALTSTITNSNEITCGYKVGFQNKTVISSNCDTPPPLTRKCSIPCASNGDTNQRCNMTADLVILFDKSASIAENKNGHRSHQIGKENFGQMKNLAKELVYNLPLKSGEVNIGLATFNHLFQIHGDFNSDDSANAAHLDQSLETMQYSTNDMSQGNTFLGNALNRIANEIFETPNRNQRLDEENLSKVILIMTDGEANDQTDDDNVVKRAMELRSKGYIILTFGIGNLVNKEQLLAISGQEKYVFLVADFNEISKQIVNVSTTLCTINCEISEWSEWANCEDGGTRTREITNTASLEQCPELEQERDCLHSSSSRSTNSSSTSTSSVIPTTITTTTTTTTSTSTNTSTPVPIPVAEEEGSHNSVNVELIVGVSSAGAAVLGAAVAAGLYLKKALAEKTDPSYSYEEMFNNMDSNPLYQTSENCHANAIYHETTF